MPRVSRATCGAPLFENQHLPEPPRLTHAKALKDRTGKLKKEQEASSGQVILNVRAATLGKFP